MRATRIDGDLYDRDFAAWCEAQAAALRAGRLDALDVTNLADELDAMGKSQRRELQSRLLPLLMHVLKVRFQPERDGSSWRGSIAVQRAEIRKLLLLNPSVRRFLATDLADAYADARDAAAAETGLAIGTFPAQCPWPIDEILPPRAG